MAVQHMRSINLREIDRLLVGHLLIDPRPASVLTLSELTAYSRRAVRLTLRKLRDRGVVERHPEGWCLSDAGRPLILKLHQEIGELVTGDIQEFSPDLLASMAEVDYLPARHSPDPHGTSYRVT